MNPPSLLSQGRSCCQAVPQRQSISVQGFESNLQGLNNEMKEKCRIISVQSNGELIIPIEKFISMAKTKLFCILTNIDRSRSMYVCFKMFQNGGAQ